MPFSMTFFNACQNITFDIQQNYDLSYMDTLSSTMGSTLESCGGQQTLACYATSPELDKLLPSGTTTATVVCSLTEPPCRFGLMLTSEDAMNLTTPIEQCLLFADMNALNTPLGPALCASVPATVRVGPDNTYDAEVSGLPFWLIYEVTLADGDNSTMNISVTVRDLPSS